MTDLTSFSKDYLGMAVFDKNQKRVGQITDLAVKMGEEFPPISSLLVHIKLTISSVGAAYYLYVIDKNNHLLGILPLRILIVAQPDVLIKDLMVEAISVEANAKLKQVAFLFSKYNLLALPVLDKARRLVGVITVDDIVELIVPKDWAVRKRRR
ncbi:MAG: CBS domain-containing protein [Candidatus Edwardsbacteria bacterium]